MKFDVDFFRQSPIRKYFEMKNIECDTFLLNISSNKNSSDPDKLTIPINEDVLKAIRQCQFIITQDMLFYQAQSEKRERERENMMMNSSNSFYKRNLLVSGNSRAFSSYSNKRSMKNGDDMYRSYGTPSNNMSQTLHKLRGTNEYNKLFLNKTNEKKTKGENSYMGGRYEERKSKSGNDYKIKIEREEVPSMTREELLKKINDYQKSKEEEEEDFDDHSMSRNLEEENRKMEEMKKKEEEELRRRTEEEKKRKEEEKRKREEERKRKEEEERKRKEEEEKKEEEQYIEEEEKDNKNEKDAELLEDKIEDHEDDNPVLEDQIYDDEEEKAKQEEEQRKKEEEEKRKKEEEEEEKRRKEEEEKKRQEEEEKQKREQEQEEERKKQEEEEKAKKDEEERIKNEEIVRLKKEDQEEEERKQKEEEERKRKQEEEEKLKHEEEEKRLEQERLLKEQEEILKNEKYTISFYTHSISEYLDSLSSTYLSEVPNYQKETFKIQSTLDKNSFISGIHPKLLVSHPNSNPDTVSGLCAFHYERPTSSSMVIKIIHLSTQDNVNWKKQIIQFIEYIKANIPYEEISISLCYVKDSNDELKINNDILCLFRTELGFQWSNVENSLNQERTQELIYRNPDEEAIKKLKAESNGAIKSMSVLSFTKDKKDSLISYDKYINTFSLTVLIYALSQDGEIILNEGKQMVLWDINAIKSDYLKNNVTVAINNDNIKNVELSSLFDTSEMMYEPNNNTKFNAFTLNFVPQLSNQLSLKLNGYYYNRVEGKINISKEPSTNSYLYFIPTSDGLNVMIICEMNSKLKNLLVDNGMNFYEMFYSFCNKIPKDENEQIQKKSIFIPSFNINTHLIADSISALDTVKIQDKDKNQLYVNSVDEYFDVNFGFDKNINSSFHVNPTSEDIIIKDTFIFGIVNGKILEQYQVPTIQLFMVTKDHWNKI